METSTLQTFPCFLTLKHSDQGLKKSVKKDPKVHVPNSSGYTFPISKMIFVDKDDKDKNLQLHVNHEFNCRVEVVYKNSSWKLETCFLHVGEV